MALIVKAWDILVWALVVFPLTTGGLWIRRPGLKVELSELAVPVLIVTVLALVIALLSRGRARFDEASSVRAALGLWRQWRSLLHRHPRALWAAALIVGLIWSLASLRRHWAFGSGAADLGIFTNAIWNLVNGGGYVSSVKDGMNLFADHQSPIFWAFAPFFALIQAPETLLVLQGLTLAAGAVALRRLGTQYLAKESPWIDALPLLYWSYLPLRNANAFDFHPETMMLPLFLGAIAGLQDSSGRSRLLGALAFIAALGAKESAGPVAVGIGLAWILGAGPQATRTRCRKLGVAAGALGLAAFWFDTKVVPGFFGGAYAYNYHYERFGGTGVGDLLLAPFLKPEVFWPEVLGASRLKFLFGTLAPLGFVPLLGWRAALAAVPGYLMLFLSEGDHRVSLIYHYSIEPAVGLFWALPLGLERLSRLTARVSRPALATYWVVFFALVLFGRADTYRIRVHSPTEHHKWIASEVLPCLSPRAPMAASGALVSHLATRPWIHHLPRLVTRTGPNEPDGPPVQCAVYDPAVNNWPMSREDFESLPRRLAEVGLTEIYRCGTLQIFEKNESCLACTPACPTGR